MAAFTAFNLYTLHHLQHISPLSTSSSSSSSLSFFHSLSSLPLRNPFQPKLSHPGYYDALAPRASASLPNSSTSRNDHETTSPAKTNAISFKQRKQQTGTGYSSTNSAVETLTKNSVKAEPHSERRFTRRSRGYRDRGGSTSWDAKPSGSGTSSSSHKVNERYKIKEDENMVQKQNTGKNARKKKKDQDSSGVKLRVALDMCSKRGDVTGALSLYDSARADGVKLGQHHYTVLLYLCSSAAVGVVRPAKSGTGVRTLNASVSSPNEAVTNHVDFNGSVDRSDGYGGDVAKSHGMFGNAGLNYASDSEASEIGEANPVANGDSSFVKDASSSQEYHGIVVSEDVKKYALQRGFEIYESMCLDKVQMNEAALTSVARMAMSMGDGNMAFEMVKQMKIMGINPRLRSYAPALSTYCNNGDIDKAFAVEKHMLEHGVYPEEPELEALLRVSIQAGKGDKVYSVLHKLRSSVRKVSPSTAALIIDWFNGTKASRLGKRKWDIRSIKQAIENNGGGWHGQGWLGKGKWEVSHTTIGNDGICKCCGVHLATIDLDPIETEKFAESVKSIAMMREKRSNFEKFQKWLDYYGPFEVVVDAANVGLFGQRRFMPSKINAVVNGIRQKLPSKKFPLIVLHNKRIKGDKMDQPINRALIDRWNNADALYATPTGSNDDWYWLYAAIKFKCLIVTNDEMRDHLFQLLGNDFFPKWKERHQVRFSFSDAGPEFYMPPPCSVVIQESEQGHWHIPIETEINYESERRWLCITRPKSEMACDNS